MSHGIAYRFAVGFAALTLSLGARANVGDGITFAGSGVFRPYLDIEGRYDSAAAFNHAQVGTAGNPESDFITHIRPGFSLLLSKDVGEVGLNANLDWAQYASATDLSRLFGAATLTMATNRRSEVGLEFFDDFRRSDRTSTLSLMYGAISNYNALGLAVPYRPGGGAITLAVRGQWIVESFEAYQSGTYCAQGPLCNTANISKMSYQEFRTDGEVRWKFLPRTQVLFDVAYVARVPSDKTLSQDVNRLEVQTGVTGLITPTVNATIKGGYGDTLGSTQKSFGTPLANLSLDWNFLPGMNAAGGYLHSMGSDPGIPFGVYSSHRLFVEGRAKFAQRYTFRLTGSYDRLEYSDAPDYVTGVGIIDTRLDMDVNKWLRVGAGYAYNYRCAIGVTSCLDNMFSGPEMTVRNIQGFPFVDYKKQEVYLRADVIY
jgi:hypothetical protein